MCRFFSCIVDKDGNVYTSKSDNHGYIINENNDKLNESQETIKYIRVEIRPAEENIFAEANENNWNFFVDEQTIPEWYERNTFLIKEQCFKALANWQEKLKATMIEAIEKKDSMILARVMDEQPGRFADFLGYTPNIRDGLQQSICDNCNKCEDCEYMSSDAWKDCYWNDIYEEVRTEFVDKLYDVLTKEKITELLE